MSYQQLTCYFLSGTGNSFRAARWLAEAAEAQGTASAVIPIERANPRDELQPGPGQLVGIYHPAHGLMPPWSRSRDTTEGHAIKFRLARGACRGDERRMMSVSNPAESYVHGYSTTEATRLSDQADTLAELLHHDTFYPAGSRVLEAGCGVGAQTVHLLSHSPQAHFTCVDREPSSLAAARASVAALSPANPVTFMEADLFRLPFPAASFDHAFVCFVLEHLTRPEEALRALQRVVRPGGTITVIEGDHGSTFFHPDSEKAHRTIECLVHAQAHGGGDANIGRRLFPLLRGVGLQDVQVSPRFVYCDSSRPHWVDGFTNKTFIAMVEGAREPALRLGLIREDEWAEGIADLKRSALADGTFCYTFFKATARVA